MVNHLINRDEEYFGTHYFGQGAEKGVKEKKNNLTMG